MDSQTRRRHRLRRRSPRPGRTRRPRLRSSIARQKPTRNRVRPWRHQPLRDLKRRPSLENRRPCHPQTPGTFLLPRHRRAPPAIGRPCPRPHRRKTSSHLPRRRRRGNCRMGKAPGTRPEIPRHRKSHPRAIVAPGDTPYDLGNLTLDIVGDPMVPKSVLNDLRRQAVAKLLASSTAHHAIAAPDTLDQLHR